MGSLSTLSLYQTTESLFYVVNIFYTDLAVPSKRVLFTPNFPRVSLYFRLKSRKYFNI